MQKARKFALFFLHKSPDTVHSAIFHEILEISIFIKQSRNLALRDVFMYKNTDTLRFYLQKARHFAMHFYMQKTMHFALHLYLYILSYSIYA